MLNSCGELTNRVLHYEMHSEIIGNLSGVTYLYEKKKICLNWSYRHFTSQSNTRTEKKCVLHLSNLSFTQRNDHSQPKLNQFVWCIYMAPFCADFICHSASSNEWTEKEKKMECGMCIVCRGYTCIKMLIKL